MSEKDLAVGKLEPIFKDLAGDGEAIEMESLCMRCHENGLSRFMLTKIPHFKDIVICAFECSHCGERNNEIKSASSISDKGVRYTFNASSCEDMNRQVVVSEHATIFLEDLSLEIPPTAGKAYLNTIEGVIRKTYEDLSTGQEYRRINDRESFEKLDILLKRVERVLSGTEKTIFVIDDPSGNSYIENPFLPKVDARLKILTYRQTPEQLIAMGFDPNTCLDFIQKNSNEKDLTPDTVYCFDSNCCNCSSPCQTRMQQVEIPHFREVIIMATNCDYCGYRTNEVKSGGAVSKQGKRIKLIVCQEEDLNRDILKSETCTLEIPEIELHLTTGSLGGRFTTLEGFLNQVHDELQSKVPFITGDSASDDQKSKFQILLTSIKKICSLELPCTVIIDDPLAQSYVQNLYAPDPDPAISIELYDRTFDQNEELGLNDIKVENYEQN